MKSNNLSVKHIAINKANSAAFFAIGLTSFIVVLTFYAGYQLLGQIGYQTKVINEKEKTRNVMKKNVKAAESLKNSYQQFIASPQNVIGGNTSSDGDKDGDNAKIVLDALPSKYDFPALTSSFEKLITKNGYILKSITGSDDELNQSSSSSGTSVEIPFGLAVSTNSGGVKDMLLIFEKSIRPITLNKLSIAGEADGVEVTLDGKTYYQPATKFNVKSEPLKSGVDTKSTMKKGAK